MVGNNKKSERNKLKIQKDALFKESFNEMIKKELNLLKKMRELN